MNGRRGRVNQITQITVVILVLVLAAAGCGSGQINPGSPNATLSPDAMTSEGTASRVPAADPRLLGAADTAFGFDLLRAWCRSEPGSNIVFSPQSLAAGLGLAYLGARGGTATAMASVLHLPAASGPRTLAEMRARWTAFGRASGPGVTLAGSNRVWSDPSLPPLRSYLDAVATGYGAGLSLVPLGTHPATAEQIINAAIDRDTRGHIPDLFPPGALNGTRWVLTNALYMDAAWATPFQVFNTQTGPFSLTAGRTVTARFMHGTGYRYATAAGWTGVLLPYRGGRLAMTALLPPAGSTGCPLPPAAGLARLTAGLAGHGATANVALPKVNLATHQRMNNLLAGLGMGIAFGPDADFGGLSPAASNISIVEHAATLEVGERGTVGSAATGVGSMPSAARVVIGPSVDFDRPYLMLVTDTATGEPLFLARVANPVTS
jgi:serpin B